MSAASAAVSHCILSVPSTSLSAPTRASGPNITSSFPIEIPPKVWRPKVRNAYKIPTYGDELDPDLYVCPRLGKSLRRTEPLKQLPTRTDIRLWNTEIDQAGFDSVIKLPQHMGTDICTELTSIIQDNWDCFYAEGARRPMLGFEFCIDTGDSPPVACRQPNYGIHEGKIMTKHVNDLKHNDHVRKCGGPWLSKIVLAPKPHQEHIQDILDFIWRFCVNYRGLNSVTLPYHYPIPRCDDALDNFGDSKGRLYFISVDAKSGYHQIAVHEPDQEKLAFFTPELEKLCFTVMPFGPMNAPPVYTAIMQIVHSEASDLFDQQIRNVYNGEANDLCAQRIRNAYPDFLACVTAAHGIKTIMDDSLLWNTDPWLLLLHFRCLCETYKRYRLSFNPKKCDFFSPRFEWIGNDLKVDGNSPAQSKFDLITNWTLPQTGDNLSSFIGLLGFYSKFIPLYEQHVGPLRSISRQYNRKPIPQMAWTPALISTFDNLKIAVTSDPCLARFDESLPIFLKTDWSNQGMSFILMQPADDAASKEALRILEEGGENLFDRIMSGARLRPIRFGSRRCTEQERHLHSFTGEASTGRWGIGQNRRYLWGAHFYWLCDCNSLKEVFDYSGTIYAICRIAQELLGYHFTFLHRPARMMRDVDALNRFYDPLIASYEALTLANEAQDREARPFIYEPSAFPEHAFKCPPVCPSTSAATIDTADNDATPPLPTTAMPLPAAPSLPFSSVTTETTLTTGNDAPTLPTTVTQSQFSRATPSSAYLFNFPICITTMSPVSSMPCSPPNTSANMLTECCLPGWLSVGSQYGSLAHSLHQLNPELSLLPLLLLEHSPCSASLCQHLLPSATILECPFSHVLHLLQAKF